MASIRIEERLQSLEAEVAELKRRLGEPVNESTDWLKLRWGAFAGDAAYEEAMRLGAEWRKKENAKSLRRPKKKRKNVRP